MPDTSEPARMVVLRNAVRQADWRIESGQEFLDVSLEGEEIKLSRGFMDGRQSQVSARAKQQRPAFTAVPVDFAHLVHLKIADAPIEVPLQRRQHPRYERCPQDRCLFAHWIAKPDRLNIRIELLFLLFIAEGVGGYLAISGSRQKIAQLAQ